MLLKLKGKLSDKMFFIKEKKETGVQFKEQFLQGPLGQTALGKAGSCRRSGSAI